MMLAPEVFPAQESVDNNLICSRVISWTGDGKSGRGRPHLTSEEFVERDLKDWNINKELALDRRE
jgi:hypothetical protein